MGLQFSENKGLKTFIKDNINSVSTHKKIKSCFFYQSEFVFLEFFRPVSDNVNETFFCHCQQAVTKTTQRRATLCSTFEDKAHTNVFTLFSKTRLGQDETWVRTE